MSDSPKDPSTCATVGLLLGLGAATAGVLYLWSRHTRAQHAQDNSLPGKPPTVPDPQPGDILLFHNARGLNRLITGFTGSPFYHAALYAGDNQTIEARTPGVLRGNLRGREKDFVVAPAPEKRGLAALAWAETQVGDSYDELDIAVIILDRLCRRLEFNYTPRNKFSCGEFIAVAFEKAGLRLFPDRDMGDVVPGDFAYLVPARERKRAR